MGFDPAEATDLLAACHRCCCVCHRFCGVKIELDHIVPSGDGGSDDIDNAIPVCFDCHAEIHHYNTRHPKGRKFRPEELRRHREEWLRLCKEGRVFSAQAGHVEAGPLEAMIDELDFNRVVAAELHPDLLGCPFARDQFERAVASGSLALLAETPRRAILDAYVAMGRANHCLQSAVHFQRLSDEWAAAMKHAQVLIERAATPIEAARTELMGALGMTDDVPAPPRSAATPVLSRVEVFRQTIRSWRNLMIASLQTAGGAASGNFAYYDVPPAQLDCADWAVAQGLFKWSNEKDDRLVLGDTEETRNLDLGIFNK